ncbi:MAG: glycosyltransferase family 2 protein [bacterium]|nr:glycosyltransferase family 2 protein [bacterium]
MPQISIIILTFNSAKFIKELLQSLFDRYKKDIEEEKIEIILVDNASGDGTIQKVKDFKLKLIENKENIGFAAGINAGAKHAKGKYLLFLNPDSKLWKGSFYDLVSIFEKDGKIGIVGGKILDEYGKPENSAGKFLGLLGTLLLSLGLDELLNYRFSPKTNRQVDFASGGFMMIRSDIFEKLSGFDENYFMYVEDIDLCLRARKENYKTYFSPDAAIFHKGQGSSSRSFAIKNIYKGLLYFQTKHGTKLSYSLVKSLLLLKASVLVLIGKIINNKYLVQSYKEALEII